MPSNERVIGRNKHGQKVLLIKYGDATDLHTDGRVLLTPDLARKVAVELKKWAAKEPK